MRAANIRRWCATLAILALVSTTVASADSPQRVLRIGMPLMPDTMDPARTDSMQAQMIVAGVFDTLYVLDPLASPAAIVPSAAAALPEVSPDHRTFTIRVRPGIHFTPHPRFGGKPRELTAEDFAYSLRRMFDPTLPSPNQYLLGGKIAGLDALAARAREAGRALDYDAPVQGLVVVDRWTLRIHLTAPEPTFPFLLAMPCTSAVPREVVEAERADFGLRPVGSGAYVVSAYTPGQRLQLVRNPGYRTRSWEDLLTPASRAGSALHAMAGRKLPGADRVDFSSTPEPSAELMALRRNELDLILLSEPALATNSGQLKRELVADGLRMVRDRQPGILLTLFSMRDPTLGGTAPDKIALRRAIQMSIDGREWMRVFGAGFASERQQVVPPGIEGHIDGHVDPNRFDRATANALLDRFGYRRGSDGYRRKPDGSPLVIPMLAGTSAHARRNMEFFKRMLDPLGLRIRFENLSMGERLKRMTHCAYGMASMDFGMEVPDGTNVMGIFYSKAIGSANLSCFDDADFDAAYERARVTPPGPARMAYFRTMQARIDAYVPAGLLPVSDALVLTRGHVIGPFGTLADWLQLVTLTVVPPSAAQAKR